MGLYIKVIKIIIILLFSPFLVSSQYELKYEGNTKWSSSPHYLKVLWSADTSWCYAYFGDDFIARRESPDGRHVYLTKMPNTKNDNFFEVLKLPNENAMYLMEPVLWEDDFIHMSKDNYSLMEYIIEDSIKMIDSLRCQLASTIHRCRKYIIWFSTDIPIPTGPWKFHGLPGVIVNVKSEDEKIEFNLISIRQTKNEISPIFSKYDIELELLPYWNEQKDKYEIYLTKMKRKAGQCKKCPKNVTSKFEMNMIECFE